MRDIFNPHVREVHITETRNLRLRVTGIGQAIDVLSFIAASLKIMGPKNPEASVILGEEGCEGIEKVEITYMPKEKAHYKNVYIINLTPHYREGTTLIFNEDEVEAIGKRLRQLVTRFTQESNEYIRRKTIFEERLKQLNENSPANSGKGIYPELKTVYPPIDDVFVHRFHSVLQMTGRSRDPNIQVEVKVLTLDEIGQMAKRLRELKRNKNDKTGTS